MKRQKVRARKRSRPNWFAILSISLIAFVAIEIVWMKQTQSHHISTYKPEPTESHGMHLPNIAEAAKPFLGDSTIGPLFQAATPALESIQDGLTLITAHGPGVRVKVILQLHNNTITNDERGAEETRLSHERTFRILNDTRPRVLVLEGYPSIVITRAGMRLQVEREFAEAKKPVTPEQATRIVERMEQGDPGLSYALNFPQCRTVGMEDVRLYNLMAEVIRRRLALWPADAQVATDPQADTLYSRLQYEIRYARSIVALAAAIQELRSTGRSTAMVVIGSAHRPDLEELMQAARIRGRFDDTTK